jgi:peptidoglycan/LPS O-acetylase OafA/YrhL
VYLWRRICRIVPAYYACLVVVYLLESGTYTLFGFVDFALHAIFLHTWADYSYLSQYGVLWTIGIEFQFYLLLPPIMCVMRYVTQRSGVAAACGLLVVATFLLSEGTHALLRAVEPLMPDRVLSARGPVLEMGTILHYLKYFALGISGSVLMLSWRRQKATIAPLVAAGLGFAGVAMLIAFSGEGLWRKTAVTGWPLGFAFFALIAAALPVCPLFSRVFETRLLAFAGQISYGMYLWHDLVLKAVFGGTLPGRLHGGLLVAVGGAIALAVTTLIAWLSFRFIEQPAMRSSCPFVTVRAA